MVTQVPQEIGPQPTDGKNPEIDEAVSKLEAGINALMDEEGFRNYLTYKGKMHNYSWLNMLLIYADYQQRGLSGPVLTMGRKGWLNQGRKVIPGSQPIALFKPVLKFWRHYYENGDEAPKNARWDGKKQQFYEPRSKPIGFEIIRKTFHVQDTEGPEYFLPDPVKLEGDEELADTLTCRLIAACAKLGVSNVVIEHRAYERANGTYDPHTQEIWVEELNSNAQRCKTLTHELCHHVAHKLELSHHSNYHATRGFAEACVEAATFAVLASFELDTTGYSVPYIAQWAQDKNMLKTLLRDIAKIADTITRTLAEQEVPVTAEYEVRVRKLYDYAGHCDYPGCHMHAEHKVIGPAAKWNFCCDAHLSYFVERSQKK